jgi:hypothetical protein
LLNDMKSVCHPLKPSFGVTLTGNR